MLGYDTILAADILLTVTCGATSRGNADASSPLTPKTFIRNIFRSVKTRTTAFCANVNRIGPNDPTMLDLFQLFQSVSNSLNIRYILFILLSMNLTCNVGFELSLLTQLRVAVGSRNLKDTEDNLIQ